MPVATLLAWALLQASPEPPADAVVREWLVLAPIDERGRQPFRPDRVLEQHVFPAEAAPPVEGDALGGQFGEAVWEKRSASEAGDVGGDPIGHAYALWESETARVVLADLQGAATLFVNGEAFAGDRYRYGYRGVPVALRAGDNHLYVTGVRGSFRLTLRTPPARLVFGDWSVTRPDFLVGEKVHGEAAVTVLNATLQPIPRLFVVSGGVGPFRRTRSLIPYGLPPLGMAKVPLPLVAREGHPLPEEPGNLQLFVSLGGHVQEEPSIHWLDIALRSGDEAYRRTFLSRIDGSVQEYSVRAPTDPGRPDLGIVLTLHGAGVDARNQAAAYGAKDDWWIVAPTNRAPYGFDWQDWGRIDAYEALQHFQRRNRLRDAPVALTGHSMGGHGTWHLAVNDPDRFLAVAPSAGWCSFDTYGRRPFSSLTPLWHGADFASNTLELLPNLAGKPIYILHGEKDDNVPLREARRMASALDQLEIPYTMHVQEDAGHWWGNGCVDWDDLFATFDAARPVTDPAELDFRTADPGVDSEHHWLVVEQPRKYGRPVRIRATWDAEAKRVEVETDNARRFQIRKPVELAVVDGQDLAVEPGARGPWFVRDEDGWTTTGAGVLVSHKGPHRSGPFKRAFDRDFILVYGTGGDPEENAALLARARYDAQQWWYLGNGNARLASDRTFLMEGHDEDFSERNVILYGNQDSNAAWSAVIPDECPLLVRRNEMRLGKKVWRGPGYGAIFVQPRKGEHFTLAAAFADTGLAGTKLGYLLEPFRSGVGYPDYVVFGPEVMKHGDGGVMAAGWFETGWGMEPPVLQPD